MIFTRKGNSIMRVIKFLNKYRKKIEGELLDWRYLFVKFKKWYFPNYKR